MTGAEKRARRDARRRLSYLRAGARLMGCTSNDTLGGGIDIRLPDGTRYVSDEAREWITVRWAHEPGNGVPVRRALTLDEVMSVEDLLLRHQPRTPADDALDRIAETVRTTDPEGDRWTDHDVIVDILRATGR